MCDRDIQYIIFGLFFGCIASYYGVFVNEHMSRVMTGDFSNSRLWLLLQSSILTIIATSARGSLFTYAQKCMNHRMRCAIYQKLLNQPTKYYQTTAVSTLLENITNDVRIVSDIISLNINVMSRSAINLIITFWLLSNISCKLTIIAIIIIPCNFLISKVYDKIHQNIMEGFEDANKEYNTYVHESISHISIIKTYATEDISHKQHNRLSNNIAQYYYKESVLYAFNAFIVFNMPVVTTIIVILSAKYLNITEGLVTFILHNQSIYGTVKSIIDFRNEFIRCKEPYERILELLDTPSQQRGYYIPNDDIKGAITFKNVDFRYEPLSLANTPENILTNFNFHIKQGEKIAIIGPSGCGKSTIAKLLIGILRPTNPAYSNIYIDNISILHFDNVWLKGRIGYVAQDSILFSDTIANNIAYGMQKYTQDDVYMAAKLANADEFISKLPNAYNTKLEGTELSSLSGGQKQRICIARALIRKPKIIIFDEATSALDPYCEEIVQNTIKECCKKQHCTMIIIAHRKSALDMADKIYTLENSQLVLR